jgi:homoserine kinase
MPLPPSGLEIRVPASIANLGPGFDTLAVAVQLYLNLSVRPMHGSNQLHFEFPDCKIDGENYIERAFRFVAQQRNASFPSMHVA